VDIRHGAAAAEKMVGQRATTKAAAPRLQIPEQAAHRFRDDAAHLFRLIAARHSD
jgi:hypothetical protein